MTEKLCRKCERLLPIEKFRRMRKKDGTYYYSSPCLDCKAFQQANWYAQNKKYLREKRRDYMREFRATRPGYDKSRQYPSRSDPVKRRVYQKRYRDAHRDEINAKSRAYYAANRDAVLQRKRASKIRRAYKRQIGILEREGEQTS